MGVIEINQGLSERYQEDWERLVSGFWIGLVWNEWRFLGMKRER